MMLALDAWVKTPALPQGGSKAPKKMKLIQVFQIFRGRISRGQICTCVGVCAVCRSELGVSGEKGQVSGTADECRSYISSRPPQTPEQ